MDNQTEQTEQRVDSNAASVAVFHKVRKLGPVQLILGLFVVIILIAAGIAAYVQLQPALKVGKYSYSKTEYKRLIDQAASIKVSEADARKALTKAFASREAADRLKVAYPTDAADLNEAARYEYKIDPDSVTKISDYQRAAAVYRIVEANIRFATKGGYKVSVAHFPFARYIYGFDVTSKTAANGNEDLVGDSSAIARDMGYAYKKGEELLDAYESKKKTFEQVVQVAQADPILSYGKAAHLGNHLLIEKDGTIGSYKDKGSFTFVEPDQFEKVKAGKGQLGKASALGEELVSPEGLPANSFIARGDQIAVGYYFLIVDSVTSANASLLQQYDSAVAEIENA